MHARLPWLLTNKESTCQYRRHEFDPWSGKIPHVTEQLSPCAMTTNPLCALEPQSLNYWSPHILEPTLHNKRKPPQWEACAPRLESSPHLLQLEKACAQHQRPSAAKNKQINLKYHCHHFQPPITLLPSPILPSPPPCYDHPIVPGTTLQHLLC